MKAEEAEEILRETDDLLVYNQHNAMPYATPLDAVDEEAVMVSRIRQDPSTPNCLNMWVCCDNMRKGAALNAVQIAQALL